MSGLIAAGEHVQLRDREPADLETYLRWMQEGQWRDFDAPWEHMPEDSDETRIKQKLAFLSRCENLPEPRDSAIIADREGLAMGWINRYLRRRGMEDTWFLGINICEDESLERGFGTEALRLWIDYLFGHSEIHRLALDTWSFNARMIRVAEKVGFKQEGCRREEINWRGKWLDHIEFGLLRKEWRGKT